jgi:hypothetical protein
MAFPLPKGDPRLTGRPKGSRNKIFGKTHEEILAGGESPLEFLVRTYQDVKNEYPMRLDAAKAAAPYMHAKLANHTITGDVDIGIRSVLIQGVSPDSEGIPPAV